MENLFTEKTIKMLNDFVKNMDSKRLEFVTTENEFTYHVGYKKNEHEERTHFVTRKKDSLDPEIKPISQQDYKNIGKGKILATSFFIE